jgi:hypothetical protein
MLDQASVAGNKSDDVVICNICTTSRHAGTSSVCPTCHWACSGPSRKRTWQTKYQDDCMSHMSTDSIFILKEDDGSAHSDDDDDDDGDDDDDVEQKKNKKRKKINIVSKEQLEIEDRYLQWKGENKNEPLGTLRDLVDVEKAYFNVRLKRYAQQKALRDAKKNKNVWVDPPHSFFMQYHKFQLRHKPPPIELLERLHLFTQKYLGDQPRMQWQSFLSDIPGSIESRFCWCLLFMKPTNGVSDKVSVGHFSALICKSKAGPLCLQDLTNKYLVASILRQTSKWVMNTVS